VGGSFCFEKKKIDELTIAKIFVEEIICRHETPTKLLTDRGKSFIGKLMMKINKTLNIQKVTTSPNRPQVNGITERFNKTLIEMLSMYVSHHQRDWYEFLPYLLFAYRNSVHSSTNETPFLFGSFGKDPQMIDDLKEREEMTVEEYKKVINGRKITKDLS
jgi:uncharacterized UBP type Zn finger protein